METKKHIPTVQSEELATDSRSQEIQTETANDTVLGVQVTLSEDTDSMDRLRRVIKEEIMAFVNSSQENLE